MKKDSTKGIFMPNEKIMAKVYENGDTEYFTPLPEIEINAYKSDIELGKMQPTTNMQNGT